MAVTVITKVIFTYIHLLHVFPNSQTGWWSSRSAVLPFTSEAPGTHSYKMHSVFEI